MQFPVGAACALGKHEDLLAGLQQADGGLQGGRIRLVAIHGNGLPVAHDQADERMIKQCLAGEKMQRLIKGLADERRVEKTDMIGRDDGRSVEVQVL